MNPDQLRGHRILVVEDDALLAMAYDDILTDAGAEVIGPAGTLEEAGKLAVANGISAALLDVRLGDDEVWPVARLLASKGVPFAFCTGHFSADTLAPEWTGRPILTKPARPQQIITALTELLTA